MPRKAVQKTAQKVESKNTEMQTDTLDRIEEKMKELEALKSDIENRAKHLTPDDAFSPLINKTVKLVPIQKAANDSIKDPSEATFLTRTTRTLVVPTNEKGYLTQPLTDEERKYFENILKIDLNHLEPDPKKNFWASDKAKIKFRKTTSKLESATVTLNLNKPYDYILYKIALCSPRVANSWNERFDRGEYLFVIEDEIDKFAEEMSYTDKEDFVQETLLNKKHHKKYLYDLLRLYGTDKIYRTITIDTDTAVIYNELKKLIRNKKDVLGLYNTMKTDTKVFNTRVFLEDAITFGILIIRGNEYTLKGGQVIGYSKDDALAFFANPENQSVKLQIKSKIASMMKEKNLKN